MVKVSVFWKEREKGQEKDILYILMYFIPGGNYFIKMSFKKVKGWSFKLAQHF